MQVPKWNCAFLPASPTRGLRELRGHYECLAARRRHEAIGGWFTAEARAANVAMNLGAVSVELTLADLRKIEDATAQIEVQGARLPEAVLKFSYKQSLRRGGGLAGFLAAQASRQRAATGRPAGASAGNTTSR